MVCRDAVTLKSRPVSPLILSTPEEKELHAIGEGEILLNFTEQWNLTTGFCIEHKVRKHALQQGSLSKVPPSSAESRILHELFLNYGEGSVFVSDTQSEESFDIPVNGVERVWMEDTKIESLTLMYPQSRK